MPRPRTIGGAATCPGHFLAESLGAVVLVLASLILFAPAPAHGQAAAEDTKAAALKERNRLREETRNLCAVGKTAEAIAAAEAMLALECRLAGGDHPVVAESLGWLATLHVERRTSRRRKRHGASAGHPAEGPRRVRLAGRRCPPGPRGRRVSGQDGPRSPRPPGRGGPAQPTIRDLYGSGQYAEAVPDRRVRSWRSARRRRASATPTPPPA